MNFLLVITASTFFYVVVAVKNTPKPSNWYSVSCWHLKVAPRRHKRVTRCKTTKSNDGNDQSSQHSNS